MTNTNISINQNNLKYCIYRITNKINNKSYIGQHSYVGVNPMCLKDGVIYTGSGKLLHKAYDKYGLDNFFTEVLIKDISDKKEIDQLEKDYISKERKVKGKENVYNISDGGTGGKIWGDIHPNIGKKYFNNSQEQVYCYECPEGFVPGSLHRMSEEQKKSISESKSGERNNFYGKKWYHTSDGQEKIMSEEEALKDDKWILGRLLGKRYDYNITEEERQRRSDRMKGHKVSDEMKKKISDTVRNTCSSEEWKKEHSLRTKEGMKKIEPMSAKRDRYNKIKDLDLLGLLGIYDNHWNKFRSYEKEHGTVDIDLLLINKLGNSSTSV